MKVKQFIISLFSMILRRGAKCKQLLCKIISMFKLAFLSNRMCDRKMGNLYPNKKFYVIRCRSISSSLGPMLIAVCEALYEAEKRGMIPVIDFSFNENCFVESNELGTVNWWEYYYEQPTHYSLRAVYASRHVTFSDIEPCLTWNGWNDDIIENEEIRLIANEMYRKYIHLSNRAYKEIFTLNEDLFLILQKEKVLGVAYRGTDYKRVTVKRCERATEYPQLPIEAFIEKSRELMRRFSYEYIFLGTEAEEAAEEFKKAFGDKLLITNRKRFGKEVINTYRYQHKREENRYLNELEYLSDILALSKCEHKLLGKVGMLSIQLIMNPHTIDNIIIFQ